jgi:hypothetical protein
MSVHRVYIVDAASRQSIEAELHDELGIDVLLDIEDQWINARVAMQQQLRNASVPVNQWPQSLHWDWSRKSIQLSLGGDPDDCRIFGIRRLTVWEGAMLTQRKNRMAKLPPDAGKGLVYVDYLEVAPWNWTVECIGQMRKNKAVGSMLLRAVVEQSYAEGHEGRVGLHALPQAEEFYREQGLAFVLQDANKRMPYYELTAVQASSLRKG